MNYAQYASVYGSNVVYIEGKIKESIKKVCLGQIGFLLLPLFRCSGKLLLAGCTHRRKRSSKVYLVDSRGCRVHYLHAFEDEEENLRQCYANRKSDRNIR